MSTSEDSPVKLLNLRNNISTNNKKPPPKLNQAFTLGPTPFTLEDSPVFNNNMSPTFNAQGIQLKTKEDQPDLPKISQEIENENLAQEENQTIEFSGLDKEEKVNQEEEVDKDPLKEDQNEIKIDNPSDNVNHTAEIDHFNPNKEISKIRKNNVLHI